MIDKFKELDALGSMHDMIVHIWVFVPMYFTSPIQRTITNIGFVNVKFNKIRDPLSQRKHV